MRIKKTTVTVAAIWCCLNGAEICLAQNKQTEANEIKRKLIENNVCGYLLINDEKPSTLLERMLHYNVKGVSIAVIENYKVVWANGYGWADEEEKREVTTETLFEPGSISKSINALGILKLAQQHLVDLNSDINKYLTTWKFPYDSVSRGKKITLAAILSHNAGLNVHGFPGHDPLGPIPTVTDVLDGRKPALTQPVRSLIEPGLGYQYSGGGITISQVLLTDVTHQNYAQWMYDSILKPIGMVNSFYNQPPPANKLSLCASGYNGDGTRVTGKFHVYPEQAAAGLWMTPTDLCSYIIDMQLAYKHQRPSKVLNNETLQLHLTPYNGGPASMGSFIFENKGEKYFEHGAGNDGFCGDFYGSLDSGYGCVVFLNSDNPKLVSEIINSIANAYNWKGLYKQPERKKCITVSEKLLKSYEGIYLFDENWAGIAPIKGVYYFHNNNTDGKMYFTSETSFFNEEFPAVKEFIKNRKGIVEGYKRTVNGKSYPKAVKVTNPLELNLPATTFHEISLYLMSLKQYSTAILYLRRGTELHPEDSELLLNLGNMYLYNGEYEKAMLIYKSNLKSKENDENNWEYLMRFYVNYYRGLHYDVQIFKKVFGDLNIPWDK